jgi:hypothetical protein
MEVSMRGKLVFASFALALAAGAASAAEANPGLQQIANQLGLESGAYSATELHQLLAAREDGDQSAYAWLLAHGDTRTDAGVSAGKAQLAAQVNLNPAEFTTAELIQIDEAKRRSDLQGVTFYTRHENRNEIYHPQPDTGRDS